MRLNVTLATITGAALLGMAMGALVVGFSCIVMPATQALIASQTWIFASITTVVVTLITSKPFTTQPRS